MSFSAAENFLVPESWLDGQERVVFRLEFCGGGPGSWKLEVDHHTTALMLEIMTRQVLKTAIMGPVIGEERMDELLDGVWQIDIVVSSDPETALRDPFVDPDENGGYAGMVQTKVDARVYPGSITPTEPEAAAVALLVLLSGGWDPDDGNDA